ncbi:hypothetical protein ACFW6U_13595 [Pseudomonas guariconensis]|uniref:hypothetical protein n=1 Tax=Pseudomonas guariconensis TaxID=1288410 RepID=UPI00366EF965
MLSRRQSASSTAQECSQPRGYLSRSERYLLRWYRRLAKEDQASMLRFVKAMAIANQRPPT